MSVEKKLYQVIEQTIYVDLFVKYVLTNKTLSDELLSSMQFRMNVGQSLNNHSHTHINTRASRKKSARGYFSSPPYDYRMMEEEKDS